MYYQNWKLASFAIIMMPLAALVAKSLGKRMGKVTTESAQISARLSTFLSEMIKGSRMTKIYQQEENYKKAIENFHNAVSINPYRQKYKAAINNMVSIFAAEGTEYERMRDFESALKEYLSAYKPSLSTSCCNILLLCGSMCPVR